MSSAQTKKQILQLTKLPENQRCAECPAKLPKWASTNLGVFICLQCSGVHRKLGTHISKVKSATLDDWTPAQVRDMQRMGNEKANAYYEGNKPDHVQKPRLNGDARTLERYLRAKYERKEWVSSKSVSSSSKESNSFVEKKTIQVSSTRSQPENSLQRSSIERTSTNASRKISYSNTPKSTPNCNSNTPRSTPKAESSMISFNETPKNDNLESLLFSSPQTSKQHPSSAVKMSVNQTVNQAEDLLIQEDRSKTYNDILSLYQSPPAPPRGMPMQHGHIGSGMMRPNMMPQPNMMQNRMMPPNMMPPNMMPPNMMPQPNMMMQNRMMPNGMSNGMNPHMMGRGMVPNGMRGMNQPNFGYHNMMTGKGMPPRR